MRLERRLEPSRAARLTVPMVAAVIGVLVGGVVIQAGGNQAVAAYLTMFRFAFGWPQGWEGTLTQAAPLILTGLAVALPARMGLWNIGGEGQLTVGAIAASGIGLCLPIPGLWLPLAMVLGAILAGGAWALIAALPRALTGLNEIIVTLFLNYIAIELMSYLVNGPWGDKSAIGFAYSRAIPDRADLPRIAPSLTIAILIALGVAVLLAWIANHTPTGLTIRLVGSGPRVSTYLGLSVNRLIIAGFFAAGGIAGLAGAIQVMGVTQRLEPGISSSYGYSGILVAFLARGSVIGVVVGAVLYGALIMGGLALQGTGVSSDISTVVQALIVLFLLSAEAGLRYRVAFTGQTLKRKKGGSSPDSALSHDDIGDSVVPGSRQ